MAAITVGVVREWVPGERRVAMVPEVVARLRSMGVTVLVEAGAGAQAWFADSAYVEAGATVVAASTLDERSDVLLCVQPPDPQRVARLRAGQVLVGMLNPYGNHDLV